MTICETLKEKITAWYIKFRGESDKMLLDLIFHLEKDLESQNGLAS